MQNKKKNKQSYTIYPKGCRKFNFNMGVKSANGLFGAATLKSLFRKHNQNAVKADTTLEVDVNLW